MRRTGHLADPPELVARRLGLHLHPSYRAMRGAALPLSTSNRVKLLPAAGGPGILDQHDTGSCEGHAHASGVTLRMALAGTPLAEVVSPVGLYLGALLCSRGAPAPDGTLPALRDTGTDPSSVLTAMGLWGSCGASAWGQYPASSSTMYVTPSDPNSALIEPAPEQLYAESSFRLKGAYFVQSTGDQKALDIMAALAARFPVSIAIPASGADFQGYKGGVLGALSGPFDHANLIVDYSWDGTNLSSLQVIVVNSWGTGWGESDVAGVAGGMYRANRDFVAQLEDACVLDVVRA